MHISITRLHNEQSWQNVKIRNTCVKDAQSTFGSSGNSSNGLSTFSETGLTFSTSCNWKNTRIENNTRARHWMLERKKKGKKDEPWIRGLGWTLLETLSEREKIIRPCGNGWGETKWTCRDSIIYESGQSKWGRNVTRTAAQDESI